MVGLSHQKLPGDVCVAPSLTRNLEGFPVVLIQPPFTHSGGNFPQLEAD